MEFIDFRHTDFNLLMQRRVYRVLLVCSNYNFFLIEEDGRIDEQIFNEYTSLSIRFPPVIVQADTEKKALEILEKDEIDLVILMLNIGETEPFELAHLIKKQYPDIPIVILTQFSREVSIRLEKEDLSVIDHVFCWLGNADLLVAIIKLIEDHLNAQNDVLQIGVQAILLVEDSVRYISQILPNLYKIIFQQSHYYAQEGVNEHQKMLRLRGRPKILLAKTFDEAYAIYQKYGEHLLGIISDVSYKKNRGKKAESLQGIELCKLVRKDDKNMPFLLQSSDLGNSKYASELNAGFVHKLSKSLNHDLNEYVVTNFGFGDLVFKNPEDGTELYRITDLASLQQMIFNIPDDVLIFHASRNEISKWLNARALFAIGRLFRTLQVHDFPSLNEVRSYIYNAIAQYRMSKGRGVIAGFDKEGFNEYLSFSRIGDGSLGGKARGLAFVDTLIQKYQLSSKYSGVTISIPKTVVVSTSYFDEFMEMNDLYPLALADKSDEEMVQLFVHANLPESLNDNLRSFLAKTQKPVAIRSSSKLEDSLYQPFAGIYTTYMISLHPTDAHLNLKMISDAIKCVYASVFSKSGKAYINATSNVIDEEKMGIILQEVCGKAYGSCYYPVMSGVARSLNYYAIRPETPEDGVVQIAYGLGKYIVEGGNALRFSPKFPKKILQLSSPEMALRESQNYFYALNLNPEDWHPSADDKVNLMKLEIKDAQNHAALKQAASVFDFENHCLTEDWEAGRKKLITFSKILNYNSFPLASVLQELLTVGSREMNSPVEIEFAVDLDENSRTGTFYFLQIRPIADNEQTIDVKIESEEIDKAFIYSSSTLGNGIIKDIADILYVKPSAFKSTETKNIAVEIEQINKKMLDERRNYVLCGPGRWGSADPFLGIPVSWPQITEARLIIESGMENYHVEPSQGTHFFQNLTSFRVAYMTINPFINEGKLDIGMLDRMATIEETTYLRWVRFGKSLIIKIDGKRNEGLVY